MIEFTCFFVLISFSVSLSYACNGYELNNVNIERCDDNESSISLENLTLALDANCDVTSSGCFSVKKQINSGNVSFSVVKKAKIGMDMKFVGKKDICKLLEKSTESSEVDFVLKVLGLEQSCPLKPREMCNKSVSVEKHRGQLQAVAGDYEGTVRGSTDSGRFCCKFTVSLDKKNTKQRRRAG